MIIILKIKESIYSKKRKLTYKILKKSILATSDKKDKPGFNLLLIFTKLLNFNLLKRIPIYSPSY